MLEGGWVGEIGCCWFIDTVTQNKTYCDVFCFMKQSSGNVFDCSISKAYDGTVPLNSCIL